MIMLIHHSIITINNDEDSDDSDDNDDDDYSSIDGCALDPNIQGGQPYDGRMMQFKWLTPPP